MTFAQYPRALVIGVAIFALVACGGQQPDPSRSDDPMPLSVGNRWQYDVGFLRGGLAETRQVVSAVPVAGGGTRYTIDSDSSDVDTLLERTTTELLLIPASNADSLEQAIGPRLLLKLPLRVGDSWSQVDRAFEHDFDGDGRMDSMTVLAESRVEKRETRLLATGVSYDAFLVVTFEAAWQQPRVPGRERGYTVRTEA